MQSSHEINAMIGVMYLFCMVIGLIPKKGLILNISFHWGSNRHFMPAYFTLGSEKKGAI